MRVIDILKSKPGVLYTTTPDTLLSKAILSMANEDSGSLLVMQNNRLVGLLSFREVINTLARQLSQPGGDPPFVLEELHVKDVMNADPIVVDPQMDLHTLRGVMIKVRQRFMPVVDNGVVLGVLSFYDVARAIYEEQEAENGYLKAYISDMPALAHSELSGLPQ